ncbi:VWA domain-containing protein [Planctomycetaceae bacterium SH139]
MNEAMNGAAQEEIVYTLSRTAWLTGWWSWAAAIALIGLLIYFTVRLYRRDTVELPTATRWTLIILRLAVIAGLILFLLGIERRNRQRITRPSEVAVLVDTSQSMSLPQDDQPGSLSRMEAATELLTQTPLLEQLANNHRVTLYTFDATGELNEVLVSNLAADSPDSAAQPQAPLATADDLTASGESSTTTSPANAWALLAAAGLMLTVLGMVLVAVLQLTGKGTLATPLLLATAILMLVSGTTLGTSWAIHTEATLASLLGLPSGDAEPAADANSQPENASPDANPSRDAEQLDLDTMEQRLARVNWEGVLVAAGGESRIGDAMRAALGRHDPATLAAMVLLTDGQNNGGTPPLAVASLVSRGGAAVYPIGFGSAKPPVNIRLVDLDVPRRVYPGDKFALSAVLQGSGPGPMTVQVQLLDEADPDASEGTPSADASEDASDEAAETGELVDSREVTVPSDGTLVGVQFEMEPQSVGRRRLTVRVVPPAGDQNAKDNAQRARYEVVSRRLRTLLVAGGPMREYRFVRNLLYRDPSVEVDVWLQTGQPGMSQDADKILTSFPATAEALFEYDAIVAFDPDWMMLDDNQFQLLDQWLSRQAGGMVLVSGPVYMPQWMRQRTDPRIGLVRDFYPVRLPNRGPLLSAGRTGGENAYPLKFAADAERADFLNLEDETSGSAASWESFGGVYDYVGDQGAKPGAKVYAYFMDPSAAIDDQLPVYLASQFYGAGRVFFQGSGEMWRLRGVSVPAFDAYYTKLIRWVSEGRLLRDSNRGILLVDRPRAMVGDTITVRAILTDEQFQPLRLPQVEAKLLTPSGRTESVRLAPLAGEPREGTYTGRFLIREPGAFELRVTLGNALDEDVLRQPIQAKLPTLELERPRRNDEVLRAMASTTGGNYFPLSSDEEDFADSSASVDPLSLVNTIEPQPQLTILPGTPDRDFQQRHNASLMWLLCSLLTMEWMVRRLNRLA